MDGAKGSALEWALALLRAPVERQGLRQRPLPADGMDVLLGIAAGTMPDQLVEQAWRFGESEADVLEAARFYAREVLFHPQADAYRTLGVAPDASAQRIKAHYRLLQHWLHPDRARSEDDALFATRVNGAWNQLRTPERRQAYDEALRQAAGPVTTDGAVAPVGMRTWRPEPLASHVPSPWRQRFPVLALCGLCLVLVLLALRDVDPPPEAWDDPPREAQAEEGGLDILPTDPASPRRVAAPAITVPARIPPRALAPQPKVPDAHGPAVAASRQGGERAAIARPSPATTSGAAPRVVDARERMRAGEATPRPAARAAPADTSASMGAAAASAVPDAAARTDDAPAFERLQAARRAGERLLDYLRKPGSAAPPIWNSPVVEARADRLRQDIHSAGRVRLADPQWRIGNDQAVLQAGVSASDSAGPAARLTVTLRWREGFWLVTALAVEAAP
jgi:curved DNA-binding protein CbpA